MSCFIILQRHQLVASVNVGFRADSYQLTKELFVVSERYLVLKGHYCGQQFGQLLDSET